jgi:hypothetical protein
MAGDTLLEIVFCMDQLLSFHVFVPTLDENEI